jgi:hypothetical protein
MDIAGTSTGVTAERPTPIVVDIVTAVVDLPIMVADLKTMAAVEITEEQHAVVLADTAVEMVVDMEGADKSR